MTTLEQARRRALSLGATFELDGRTINVARRQLSAVPSRPAPAPVTTPAAPPVRDKAEVLLELAALQVQAGAEQAEKMGKVLSQIASRFEPPPPKIVEVLAKRVQPISISVIRDAAGKATDLEPVYGDVGAGKMSALRRVVDARGLLTTIIPEYH